MPKDLEQRVAELERTVAALQQKKNNSSGVSLLEHVYGRFAKGPLFAEAMKIGREYRQSLRPRSRKTKKTKR